MYFNGGASEIVNCTITDNTGDADLDEVGNAGGLVTNSSKATCSLANTIVAGNHNLTPSDIGGADVKGIFESLGHNLIGDGDGANLVDGINGDIVGMPGNAIDPMLGPLANNGGVTGTHHPLLGSPVVDAGDSSLVSDPPFDGPVFLDQRGAARIGGAAIDIGAVEADFVYTVLNTDDSGEGSLRKAIADADAVGGGVVAFDETVFNSAPQTITLTSGQIPISSEIIMTGPEENRVTIDAGGNSRIFDVSGSGDGEVVLSRLRLINGSNNSAGAVRVMGALTEFKGEHLVFENNAAVNSAGSGGGAMAIDEASVTLFSCAFARNSSQASGGAIAMQNSADLLIVNSTVSGNTAFESGGGLMNSSGVLDLVNVTVTDNTADFEGDGNGSGGGIAKSGAAPVRPLNTIVAGNISKNIDPDVSGGLFASQGHNLIGDASGSLGLVNGVNDDLVGSSASPIDPMLNTLADNGGDTLSHHVQPGSPAIDAGDNNALSGGLFSSSSPKDQRGQVRIFGGTTEIGAYERPGNAVVFTNYFIPEHSESSSAIFISFGRTLRDGPLDIQIEIDSMSTAIGGVDYVFDPPSNAVDLGGGIWQLTFQENQDLVNIVFDIEQDSEVEPDETIVVNLLNGVGYQIDPADQYGNSLTSVIINDDFEVTSSSDSGPGSLRDLVGQIATDGSSLIIPSAMSPITLTSGEIVLSENVSIIGEGSEQAIVRSEGGGRIFGIDNRLGCVVLENLQLTGGDAADGGAIEVRPGSCLEMLNCSLTGNHASGEGGALHVVDADLVLSNCSVVSNTASLGGGIHARDCSLTIANSTIARNESSIGAGILLIGDLSGSISHTTITENIAEPNAGSPGGGIYSFNPSNLSITNSIIAGNLAIPSNDVAHPDGPDVFGDFESHGHNLIGVDETGHFSQAGDQAGFFDLPLDAQLIPHGEDAAYYLLSPYSPAVNAGDSAAPDIALLDQRGYQRSKGQTDIGATEVDLYLVSNTADSGGLSFRHLLGTAIAFGHGTIAFDTSGVFATPQTILNTGDDYILRGNITIVGPPESGQGVTFESDGGDRLFFVESGSHQLNNLTLKGGDTDTNPAQDQDGGAVYLDEGSLMIERCHLLGNAAGGEGGAVFNKLGELQIRNCFLESNLARGGNGGGVIDKGAGGNTIIANSTFKNNSTQASGGGFSAGAESRVVNSTFSGNRARLDGGGIFYPFTAGSHHLEHCTLTLNVADEDQDGSGSGGGIRSLLNSPSLPLVASIIAGNFDRSGVTHDFFGEASGLNGCLLGDDRGVSGTLALGNLFGTGASRLDPRLHPLATNGGFTPTHALRLDSPAIEGTQSNPSSDDLLFDQRGVNSRTGGYRPDTNSNGFADIGSYELTHARIDEATEFQLRAGIERVNESGAGLIDFDQISFLGKETLVVADELNVTGELFLKGPNGPGQGMTISGGEMTRVFHLEPSLGVEIIMEDLTITEGASLGQGGGIRVGSFGDVILRRCTIYDCEAELDGGGIAAVGTGRVTIENSTIYGNTTSDSGGGIWISEADVVLESTTISANEADTDFSAGTDGGGGIFLDDGSCRLRNTLIAGNIDHSSGNEDAGTSIGFTSLGNNLIGSLPGVSGVRNGIRDDQIGVPDPMLDILRDNGGPTMTVALLPGSPAINAGTSTGVPETDQRGYHRIVGTAPDIGAFEILRSYQDFMDASFPPGTPAEQLVASHDYDQDGLRNGIEFLIGSDPTVPDNSGQIHLGPIDDQSLAIEFPLANDIDARQAMVEFSRDLGQMDPWVTTGVQLRNLGPRDSTTDLIHARILREGKSSLFGRLVYFPAGATH